MIDFDDYLTEIQAPESLRTRVHDLVESYSRVVDVSNAELFVNDVMDEEGNRSFPSMWLFTGDAAYEAELSNANGDAAARRYSARRSGGPLGLPVEGLWLRGCCGVFAHARGNLVFGQFLRRVESDGSELYSLGPHT